MKIRSVDIEPDRGGSHHLIINGTIAGRFDSLEAALAARHSFLSDAVSAVSDPTTNENRGELNSAITLQNHEKESSRFSAIVA
jgi:hypothetical protein